MTAKNNHTVENIHFNNHVLRGENLVGKKIQEARLKKGISQGELSQALGQYGVKVRQGAISKWELGETVPNSYQLLFICHVLDIRELSFFTGNVHGNDIKTTTDAGVDRLMIEKRPSDDEYLNFAGQRKLQAYRSDLIASGKYGRKKPQERVVEMIDMPVSRLRASAGTGNFLDDENFELCQFPKSSVPEGADFGVYVSGDSMEPSYVNGQIVWIEKSSEISPGEVGLFTVDNAGFIKVYDEKEPASDIKDRFTDSYGVVHPQPVLVSYNPKYSPIVISPDQRLYIIGRVLN